MNKEVACFVNNTLEAYDAYKCADALYQAGFRKAMLSYMGGEDTNVKDDDLILYCKKIGLDPYFVHLSFKGCNDLWLSGQAGEDLLNKYKEDVKKLAKYGVKIVCIHLTSKFIAPAYNELGLKRIKELNDLCKDLKIKLSLENTKIKGYQEYVLEHLQDENLGICIDTGHVHCHFKDDYDFSRFDKRIFSLHIHDNHGQDDEHLLPFDGNINWQKYMSELKKNHYQGVYCLELAYSEKYRDLGIEKFYELAYERVNKLIELID